MRKTKRSAFTIVELVIVIAVIAVLSAVLIPTFGSIIKNANNAVDKSTAASLTSELHVYLRGKQITNEADLVEALDKSGVGAKLVPTDESVHFWFDMESQMIVVKALSEIASPLMLLADDEPSANVSFRELINGSGYYIVDYGILSDELSKPDTTYDVFSYIDSLKTADDYSNLVKVLGEVAEDDPYKEIAANILTKLHNTTIRTEAGAFFSADGNATKNEYFSAIATFVGSEYIKLNSTDAVAAAPNPAGIVSIPGHIDHIVENGLNYVDGTVAKITLSLDRVSILSPGFTNSNVIINEKTYVIDTVQYPNKDMLENTADETDTIPLSTKVPFENIVIHYKKDGAINDANGKIYAAFRNGAISLLVANENDLSQVSSKVEKWELIGLDNSTLEILNEETGIITIKPEAFVENITEIKVKATARDINDNPIYAEATIVVAKPATATFTIQTNSGALTFSSNDAAIADDAAQQLLYNGELTSYVTSTGGSYGEHDGKSIDDILGITPAVAVTSDNFVYEIGTGKLIFKSANVTSGSVVAFNVKADGCVNVVVKVKMVDASQALFTSDFHHDRTEERKYHIGSANVIKLSDLYDVSDVFGTEGNASKATLSIYDKGSASGQLFKINTANNDLEPTDITTYVLLDKDGNYTTTATLETKYEAKDTIEITKDNWNSIAILFDVEDDCILTNGMFSVYVELMPEDKSVSTITLFEIVDGATNVNNITDLDNLLTAPASGNTPDIVLNTDIIHTSTTPVANSVKLEIVGSTIYGNGFVISVPSYVSVATNNVFPEDDYFISLESTTDADGNIVQGIVDNIYIDGPVYSTFDYLTNTGYFVSGIKASGYYTIQNSYVSGFRQPVSSLGAKNTKDAENNPVYPAKIINTTLRGGNYANLRLVSGDIYFAGVTTIQDQNGQQTTVGTSDKITGVGIMVEEDCITINGTAFVSGPTITIDGDFVQYNWIEKQQGATLPTITTASGATLNMTDVMGWLFDGISSVKMSRFWYYVHQVEGDGIIVNSTSYDRMWTKPKQYINAGIMYIDTPEKAGGNTMKYDKSGNTPYINIVTTNKYNGSPYVQTGITLADENRSVSVPVLGEINVNPVETAGTDLTLVFYSFKDGQNWVYDPYEYFNLKTFKTEYFNVPGRIKDSKNGEGCITINNSQLIYDGYYDADGDYSAWFN